jgi:hypothetical protein
VNHYQRLGAPETATTAELRDAYRRAARTAHPDRNGSGSGDLMAEVNEAWRVLGDPRQRDRYDEALRAERGVGPAPTRSSATSTSAASSSPEPALLVPTGIPARFPWRFLLSMAVLGIVAVLVGSMLTKPALPGTPDGLLRAGDCVALEQLEAREVSCAGAHDAVVRSLIPFDQVCPTDTESYRDRQGMGTACVVRVEGATASLRIPQAGD